MRRFFSREQSQSCQPILASDDDGHVRDVTAEQSHLLLPHPPSQTILDAGTHGRRKICTVLREGQQN